MDMADTVEQETEATETVENTESAENIESVASESKPSRNLRKERIGMVVSNKMDKTAVVKIEERVTHPKYSKIMKQSIKFKVHDENNEAKVGDIVSIVETRPLSKDKRFTLVEIVQKAKTLS